MPAERLGDEALVREVVQPTALAVAHGDAEDERQVPRRPGLEEAPLKGEDELLGVGLPGEALDRDAVAVADEQDRLVDGHELVPRPAARTLHVCHDDHLALLTSADELAPLIAAFLRNDAGSA